MTRLTIAKRDYIVNEEVSTKYHAAITEAQKVFSDEILKESKKTTPSWITEEMVVSRYINTTNNLTIQGIKDPNNLNHRKTQQLESYIIPSYLPTIRHRTITFKVTKTIQNKIDKVTEIKKESETFRKKLRGVLLAFSSIKKLLEHLPELTLHFDDMPQKNALVPVAAIKEIKTLIKRKK